MTILQGRSRQRAVLLTLALAMMWVLLGSTLWAPAANASGVSVSNLVVRSITIDPQTKVATAKGALTCTGAKRGFLEVEAIQTMGRVHTAYAYGWKMIDCEGRKPFSIELTNYQGRLGPGDANVNAYSEAWTRYDYDNARFSGATQVRNAH